uniref:Uncharacterized protein n=1 Tax=Zea mays TaxID=4577 RepID=A0A804N7U5_MAIZE
MDARRGGERTPAETQRADRVLSPLSSDPVSSGLRDRGCTEPDSRSAGRELAARTKEAAGPEPGDWRASRQSRETDKTGKSRDAFFYRSADRLGVHCLWAHIVRVFLLRCRRVQAASATSKWIPGRHPKRLVLLSACAVDASCNNRGCLPALAQHEDVQARMKQSCSFLPVSESWSKSRLVWFS